MHKTLFRSLTFVLCALLASAGIGCSGYQLAGVVVEGQIANVEVVNKKDPRLHNIGVASAEVSVILDPGKLNAKEIGKGSTDADGAFSLPITESGAGFLIMDVQVQARRFGYITTGKSFRLPSSSKRLLITVVPGKDKGEFDRVDDLDRALRDAEPFMND